MALGRLVMVPFKSVKEQIDLKDGSRTLHEKLELLADKSIEFNNGVSSASKGSEEMAKGAKSLQKV